MIFENHQLNAMTMQYLIKFSFNIAIILVSSAQIVQSYPLANTNQRSNSSPSSSLINGYDGAQIIWNYSQKKSPTGQCKLQTIDPVLIGLKDQFVADRMNTEMHKISSDAKKLYQQVLKESRHCQADSKTDHQIEINVRQCRIELVHQDIISLVCSEMNSGIAAYPIGLNRAVTANLRTGKIYRYPDLFRHDIDYVDKLRTAILKSNINDITPNDYLKRELKQFSSSNSDFYLSSSCNYFSNKKDVYPFCLVISTQHMSGLWRNKSIFVNFAYLKETVSDDPDLQFLVK
jgi:hypothetical protein